MEGYVNYLLIAAIAINIVLVIILLAVVIKRTRPAGKTSGSDIALYKADMAPAAPQYASTYDDSELVAVIATAVAACGSENIQIQSVRRINETSNSWAKAGRMQQISKDYNIRRNRNA